MKISGIAAVVTGGGSGIGAATARHLAALGAKVTVLDVNKDNAEAVAKEIDGLAQVCDVTDAGSVQAALAAATAKHGGARLVVNCAGIANASRILTREGPHDLELFKRVININLIGSFNVLRLAADEMSKLPEMDEG